MILFESYHLIKMEIVFLQPGLEEFSFNPLRDK
jgi:hypothetical protein